MPTSFDDVHLPAHTIDSVRTIVSLPLLYPSAFQQGILKQHSMTGCLLFGPPGTGKTLVVRALAKEAGCRMLAVQPSDVMDMVRIKSRNFICLSDPFAFPVRRRRRKARPLSLLPRTSPLSLCRLPRRDRRALWRTLVCS